mmetsp:Transcript_116560/g.370722  ORF Transcript_116560/g.370722 Transcript_116560/m.370722 type:complete len:219 (+) Transcript_116560:6611-7267(+)
MELQLPGLQRLARLGVLPLEQRVELLVLRRQPLLEPLDLRPALVQPVVELRLAVPDGHAVGVQGPSGVVQRVPALIRRGRRQGREPGRRLAELDRPLMLGVHPIHPELRDLLVQGGHLPAVSLDQGLLRLHEAAFLLLDLLVLRVGLVQHGLQGRHRLSGGFRQLFHLGVVFLAQRLSQAVRVALADQVQLGLELPYVQLLFRDGVLALRLGLLQVCL